MRRRSAGDRVQAVMKALGSPVRRDILWRVWDRERAVAEIADGLGVSGPTLSGHLAVLREAGLIRLRPEGTTRWYSADQDAVRDFRGLFDDSRKWASGQSHAEQAHAQSAVKDVVVVTAESKSAPADVFRGFTDPRVYGRCIGGDVAIEDGRFSASLPFGQVVRGVYRHVCAPSLIDMAWDFGAEDVPAPGKLHSAHLLILPGADGGARMNVTQFIASPDQAEYMTLAWTYVLGCFAERLESALAEFAPRSARGGRVRASDPSSAAPIAGRGSRPRRR